MGARGWPCHPSEAQMTEDSVEKSVEVVTWQRDGLGPLG